MGEGWDRLADVLSEVEEGTYADTHPHTRRRKKKRRSSRSRH